VFLHRSKARAKVAPVFELCNTLPAFLQKKMKKSSFYPPKVVVSIKKLKFALLKNIVPIIHNSKFYRKCKEKE